MWGHTTFCCQFLRGGSDFCVCVRGYQKSLGATVGVFFEGRYRQSLGDHHAEAGVYFGWAYGECERGAMGRWRAPWQGCTIHRVVRSHGSHLGRERGTVYPSHSSPSNRSESCAFKGKLLHTLKDHAHWVTTLSLNTDSVLRTGPFDHTGKRPSSDEEGTLTCICVKIAMLILASSSPIPCFSAVQCPRLFHI